MKLERLEPVQVFWLLLINLTKPSWMVFIITARKKSRKMPQWGFIGQCWLCPFRGCVASFPRCSGGCYCLLQKAAHLLQKAGDGRGKRVQWINQGLRVELKTKSQQTHFSFTAKLLLSLLLIINSSCPITPVAQVICFRFSTWFCFLHIFSCVIYRRWVNGRLEM